MPPPDTKIQSDQARIDPGARSKLRGGIPDLPIEPHPPPIALAQDLA